MSLFSFPVGALACLGLARAYALQSDSAKARNAYLEFLTFWKDADPDIPILAAGQGGVQQSSSDFLPWFARGCCEQALTIN
jgi:hypothetical protein